MKIDKERFLLGAVLGALLVVVIELSKFSVPFKVTDPNNSTIRYVSAATSSASMSNVSTPSPSLVPLSGFCLNAPVLLYHHVQPQERAIELGQTSLSVDNAIFGDQMEYLASNGYTAISAIQLADALRLRTPLPEKSIVITFDDGYKDAYLYVYPIVEKYNIVVNLAIPTGLIDSDGYLTWEQIEEMSRSGHVFFVNHTWSHYPLNQGSLDKIRFEVEMAKKQLEEHTGQVVDIFAYPYGSFDNSTIKVLQESGIKAAFSTNHGFWQCDSFIMTLHRNRIGNAPLWEYGL